LFHRLNVVQFRLPPLRERGDDVIVLAEHFLTHLRPAIKPRVQSISEAAQRKLLSHRWPGNVRELKNAIERALILESTSQIQAENLPDFQVEQRLIRGDLQLNEPETGPLDSILAKHERRVIQRALEQNRFNLTRTALQLDLSRHALRYRMQRLQIQPGEETDESDTPSNTAAARK